MNPIYQTEKSTSLVSPSYGFIRTDRILDRLRESGWTESSRSFAKARNPERQGYQRHLIRLRNEAFPQVPGLSQENRSVPELILVNAHDGTSRLRLMLGLWRMACANGIIAGLNLSDFSITHSERLLTGLDEGIETMVGNIPALFQQIQALQGLQFSPSALEEYKDVMARERLKHVDLDSFDPSTVGKIKRLEDSARDAFTVMNRVQESVIRGGIRYRARKTNEDGTYSLEMRHTRKVNSIAQTVALNRLAYSEAVRLAA